MRPAPLLVRAAVAALCAAALACARGVRVVVGPVTQRDTNRPVYKLHFPRLGDYDSAYNPADADIPPSMAAVHVTTARGQLLRCIVPKPTPTPLPPSRRRKRASPSSQAGGGDGDGDRDRGAHGMAGGHGSPSARFDDIDDLFSEYKDRCFLRKHDWWTYKFCYGRWISQEHIDNADEVTDSFTLGKYDRKLDLARRRNASAISQNDAVFTQEFVNGTVCGTTGKQRKTIVKFICNEEAVQLGGVISSRGGREDGVNIISSVREVSSCVYELDFLNDAICRHPVYKERMARAMRPIHCSLDVAEAPFEGLESFDHYKSPLSL